MKEIRLGNSTFILLQSFSFSIIESGNARNIDLDNRKVFLKELGRDKFLKVKEVVTPPNKVWFKNSKYLVTCIDDRYKYKSIYTINQLVNGVENISIYKIKKDNK